MKKWVVCYTLLGVSEVAHSSSFHEGVYISKNSSTYSYNMIQHPFVTTVISANEEECNMILSVTGVWIQWNGNSGMVE